MAASGDGGLEQSWRRNTLRRDCGFASGHTGWSNQIKAVRGTQARRRFLERKGGRSGHEESGGTQTDDSRTATSTADGHTVTSALATGADLYVGSGACAGTHVMVLMRRRTGLIHRHCHSTVVHTGRHGSA